MCTTTAFAGEHVDSGPKQDNTENIETSSSNDSNSDKYFDRSYYIQGQGTDEYESIISGDVDFWYENLPIYDGKVQETFVDLQSIESFDTVNQSRTIGISVASVHIDRVSQENDPHFEYWHDADLTEPINVFNLDNTLYGYAFGVIDNNKKLVGYMITGISENAPPILEYSYDPARFVILKQAPKVLFSCETGLWLDENDSLKSIIGEGISSLADLKALEVTPTAIAYKEERAVLVQEDWDQYLIYAAISENSRRIASSTEGIIEAEPEIISEPEAEGNLETTSDEDADLETIDAIENDLEILTFIEIEHEDEIVVEEEVNAGIEEHSICNENDGTISIEPPSRATQTVIPNTSDYTWQTLCTYTTMAMYFDSIGRRVEPAWMGTVRPHSIQLNQTLHSTYGHLPIFNQIATNTLNWASSRKLSSYLSLSSYYVNTSNSSCWTKHTTQISAGIPTMVGYTGSNAHIMMGIGYTSDSYYIVRDTWTDNSTPMNSTFYYNKAGYTFCLVGLNYTNSSTATAWGNVVLYPGDSNFNVRRLKIMLNLLFYSPGNLTTNTWETATTSAVKAFQSANGLTPDGIVGANTYAKLRTAHIMRYDGNQSSWRVLQIGSIGDDVAQLQIRLYRMGYLNDTCDGIFGNNTKNAVIAYQKAKGLTADGVAGVNTFAKLYGSNDTYSRYYLRCTYCN